MIRTNTWRRYWNNSLKKQKIITIFKTVNQGTVDYEDYIVAISLLYCGYWVFPEGRGGWGVGLTPHPHLVQKVLEEVRAVPLLTLRACLIYKKGKILPYRSSNELINVRICNKGGMILTRCSEENLSHWQFSTTDST